MFGKIHSDRFPTAKTFPNFTKIGDEKVVPVLLGIMTFAAMKPERSVTPYSKQRPGSNSGNLRSSVHHLTEIIL